MGAVARVSAPRDKQGGKVKQYRNTKRVKLRKDGISEGLRKSSKHVTFRTSRLPDQGRPFCQKLSITVPFCPVWEAGEASSQSDVPPSLPGWGSLFCPF